MDRREPVGEELPRAEEVREIRPRVEPTRFARAPGVDRCRVVEERGVPQVDAARIGPDLPGAGDAVWRTQSKRSIPRSTAPKKSAGEPTPMR